MKKPILGLILTHLAQIQTQNFFRKLYLFQKLDIAPRYHPKQFMEKLMSQTEENVKNLIQSPILAQIQAPNFFSELYLYQQLNIFPSYHARQFKGKLLSQTKKKSEKLTFGSNFDPFGPNLGPKFFFRSFTSTRRQTLVQAIILGNFKRN